MSGVILLAGRVAALDDSGRTSAIAKQPVSGPQRLGPEGLAADEQADRRVHGGPDKAIHHYPAEHYPLWQDDLGPLPLLDRPGAFGENIAAAGFTERDVAVGDIFSLGTALLQVSQGRQPCWKLNHRFGLADMARRVQATGRTGWYYRVLRPGVVEPGDPLERIDRPAPEWTLHRLWTALYVERMNLDELRAIAELDFLAEGWRRHAARRVASGKVEDWSKRLEGSS